MRFFLLTKCIALFLFLSQTVVLFGQSTEIDKKKKSLPIQLENSLKLDLVVGATASLSQGEYISYQKSFFEVNAPNTTITGKINPTYFFTIGAQSLYTPFSKQNKNLSKLHLLLGLLYSKQGFKNKYSSTYTPSRLSITDKIEFDEIYNLHTISVPLLLRWGNNAYVEAGISFNHFVAGTKRHNLKHTVSGSDAYKNGFSQEDKHDYKLDSEVIKSSNTGFVIGAGTSIAKLADVRLSLFFNGNVLKNSATNFKTISPQIHIIIPISHYSLSN